MERKRHINVFVIVGFVPPVIVLSLILAVYCWLYNLYIFEIVSLWNLIDMI